jgi:hypothetical protein
MYITLPYAWVRSLVQYRFLLRAVVHCFAWTRSPESRPHLQKRTNRSSWRSCTAQAVSGRPLVMETRVHSRLIPRGICCGRSGTVTGLSPGTSVLSSQYHSTSAPDLYLMRPWPRWIISEFDGVVEDTLQKVGTLAWSSLDPHERTRLWAGGGMNTA